MVVSVMEIANCVVNCVIVSTPIVTPIVRITRGVDVKKRDPRTATTQHSPTPQPEPQA
jgi:hypothetical protein